MHRTYIVKTVFYMTKSVLLTFPISHAKIFPMKDVIFSKVESFYEIIYRDTPADSQIALHTHDVVEIYLNLAYLPNAIVGNQVCDIPANTLILCPAFCPHKFFSAENSRESAVQSSLLSENSCERYILSVNISWLEHVLPGNKLLCEYLKDTAHPMLLPLDGPTCHALCTLFENYLAIRTPDSFSALAAFFDCMALVDKIILSANHRNNQQELIISGTQKTVNEMISYIDGHLCESLTLADLSAHFFLNPDYISRLFKKHTNTTLSNYITLQKITRAQALLRDGCTIGQVQLATGYSSYAHFLRTFKKHAGIPPGEYQKRHLSIPTAAQS